MEIQRYEGKHLEIILDGRDGLDQEIEALEAILLNWEKKCDSAISCSVMIPAVLEVSEAVVEKVESRLDDVAMRIGLAIDFTPAADVEIAEVPEDLACKRSHLKDLILLAAVDGFFKSKEQEVVRAIGLKMGLSDRLIKSIYNETVLNPGRNDLDRPLSDDERVQQLVDLCQVILADGKIDDWERVMIFPIAVKMGLDPADVIQKLAEMANET